MNFNVQVILSEMKTASKRHKLFDKIAKMDSHPMIWVTFQLCLVMQSQLVQAIVGSNFHQQCPDQCLCLSQIQVRKYRFVISYCNADAGEAVINSK